MPEFKVADMVHDFKALETARSDAQEIIENNLLYVDEEYYYLRQLLEKDPSFANILD